jgi:hypothetical protein
MGEYSDQEIERLLEDYRTFIYGGRSPEEAADRLRRLTEPELVEAVVEEHQKRSQRFVDLKEPTVLRGNEHIQSWYDGPCFDGAWCWPSYRELVEQKDWKQEAVEKLDESSTKIMAHLPHPGEDDISTRGLVVGYVQSGKTSNYTALISKAADVGYKAFIVLTGMTSSLRRQTQRRLERELCRPNSKKWNPLTSTNEDFQGVGNPDYMLNPKEPQGRVLCVVKKNVHILQRLIDFFNNADDQIKEDCPVLLIDDEADQASINTEKKASERSAINDKIVTLLQTLPKTVYIGYTATPFANVFIDPTIPEDLYPRDFIFDLPKPDEYFGAEDIFGRDMLRYDDEESDYDGLDMVRLIPEAQAFDLKPPGRDERFQFQPSMTDSLKEALRYFILASAARLERGQEYSHTSMLIHTTLYTYTHGQLNTLVSSEVRKLEEAWKSGDESLRRDMKRLWDRECARVTDEDLEADVPEQSFDAIEPFIDNVFSRCEVVVDNGTLDTGLEYDDNNPGAHIAIGGNTLSRGLTLEGLLVSYFIRTASAYDTLLQMGRWFGFRKGYENLPRIWMTPELQDDFVHLATVEEEIRHDIRKYEHESRTPEDFAVRVQTHPKLAVTSRLKMQNVKLESASYSDSHIQTFQFRHDDREWLRQNLSAAREFLGNISERRTPEDKGGARWLYRSVDADQVTRFLRQYQSTHEDFRTDLLLNYITSERERGSLERWNVGIVGSQRNDAIDLNTDCETKMVNRSRMDGTNPANIKALTSRADRIIDLDWNPRQQDLTSEKIVEKRNHQEPESGLLLIYPINKDSQPTDESTVRQAMNAREHIIGIGMSFPASKRDMRDYVANNLEGVFSGRELDEELEEEADLNVGWEDSEAELEG